MSNNFKSVFTVTFTSLLFSSCTYAIASKTPCDLAHKHDIHCAFVTPMAPKANKFVRVKEVQSGHPAISMTFCAPTDRPLMNIPQNQWGPYQPGNKISWQISQCQDEDCSISKPITDDKFTITKDGKQYSSAPKTTVEITLDPNYGVNCTLDNEKLNKLDAFKRHVNDSSLQMRIDDAVSMIEAIPVAMDNVTTILNEMHVLASDAANGTHSSSQLGNMDKVFQTLKDEISKAQRFNTLDGYKVLSGGTLSIQIGYCYYNMDQCSLSIVIPATDINSLGIAYDSISDNTGAQQAVTDLNYAIDIVSNAKAFS